MAYRSIQVNFPHGLFCETPRNGLERNACRVATAPRFFSKNLRIRKNNNHGGIKCLALSWKRIPQTPCIPNVSKSPGLSGLSPKTKIPIQRGSFQIFPNKKLRGTPVKVVKSLSFGASLNFSLCSGSTVTKASPVGLSHHEVQGFCGAKTPTKNPHVAKLWKNS